jgi:hypothetical protein
MVTAVLVAVLFVAVMVPVAPAKAPVPPVTVPWVTGPLDSFSVP